MALRICPSRIERKKFSRAINLGCPLFPIGHFKRLSPILALDGGGGGGGGDPLGRCMSCRADGHLKTFSSLMFGCINDLPPPPAAARAPRATTRLPRLSCAGPITRAADYRERPRCRDNRIIHSYISLPCACTQLELHNFGSSAVRDGCAAAIDRLAASSMISVVAQAAPSETSPRRPLCLLDVV
ncbi:hypothetical protein EVAR_34500_1 [Eumeta japonica]|uniref:Uncharacterized protein n=1 Tax=Eumeta variegata TaxID=151549 RepID=A0A4C1Z863_EUMVA|nr:hypothetical protein EVAR_34500_1 [Eumeta japonica]